MNYSLLYLNRISFTLLGLVVFTSVGFSQSTQDVKLLRSARASWGNLNFNAAQQQFKDALDENRENFDANFELGLFLKEVHNDYAGSLPYLEKAYQLMPADTIYELYKNLGEVNQFLGNYETALAFYKRFDKAVVKNELLKSDVQLKIKQCEFATTFTEKLWDGKFINLGDLVNTESSEYCSVVPMKDSFLLFTKRSTEQLTGTDGIVAMEDIFFTKQKNKKYTASDRSKELSDFTNLSGTEKFHNAIVSVSASGDSMVVYRKNKLWLSTFESNTWTIPTKMSKEINLASNQRHGIFSADGNQFYFSSNSSKGQGGYDLFVSSKDSAGNWSEAKNLGARINTSRNEDSPFLAADGKRLYFASTGHVGFGGYDIFYSEWEDTAWSEPKNAGKPFNSPADDIYFHIVNDERHSAMLSSSRKGGFGQMDLYYFYQYGESKFENCTPMLTQDIADSTTELNDYILIAGLDTVSADSLTLYNPDLFCVNDSTTHIFWKLDTTHFTQKDLSFTFDTLQVGTHQITLEVLTRDSLDDEHRYCTIRNIEVKLAPKKVVEKVRAFKDTNEIALSIGSKIKESDMIALPDDFNVNLESIYFSFNKSDVRKDQRAKMDANIKLIKANPNIVIKIIGYTDLVGSKDYNAKLSQKRAKSTVAYLTKKGVKLNQIVAVLSNGEDETGKRYKNADGTDDLEKMEVSRRVDFYVIGKLK